jgi:hypothetical protein
MAAPEPNLWPLGTWLQHEETPEDRSALNTLDLSLGYPEGGRIPLILVWVAAFATQALVRSAIHGTPWNAGLMPMIGFAFILFTFYMITDPATSPAKPLRQVAFGCAVALSYAAFMELHIVFGLFYALTAATAVRGIFLALRNRFGWSERPVQSPLSPYLSPASRRANTWLKIQPRNSRQISQARF